MNDQTPEQFEASLTAIAVHEAGHFECSIALAIPATMRLTVDAEGNLSGGFCERDFSGSDFDRSCVSWAGIIAENLCARHCRCSAKSLFPLNEEYLFRWHEEISFFLSRGEGFSTSDRNGIICVKNTFESCCHAYRILSKRIREIEQDAALLVDRTRREIAEKLAALRQFEEAKQAASEWASNNPVLSPAGRAQILADFIDGLPPGDPRRLRLAPVLACLRRGEVPELNGELKLTDAEKEALMNP